MSSTTVRVRSASRVSTASVARTATRASSSVMAASASLARHPEIHGHRREGDAKHDPPRPPVRPGVLFRNVSAASRASLRLLMHQLPATRTRERVVILIVVVRELAILIRGAIVSLVLPV